MFTCMLAKTNEGLIKPRREINAVNVLAGALKPLTTSFGATITKQKNSNNGDTLINILVTAKGQVKAFSLDEFLTKRIEFTTALEQELKPPVKQLKRKLDGADLDPIVAEIAEKFKTAILESGGPFGGIVLPKRSDGILAVCNRWLAIFKEVEEIVEDMNKYDPDAPIFQSRLNMRPQLDKMGFYDSPPVGFEDSYEMINPAQAMLQSAKSNHRHRNSLPNSDSIFSEMSSMNDMGGGLRRMQEMKESMKASSESLFKGHPRSGKSGNVSSMSYHSSNSNINGKVHQSSSENSNINGKVHQSSSETFTDDGFNHKQKYDWV